MLQITFQKGSINTYGMIGILTTLPTLYIVIIITNLR